ncbi:hypothetical protein [Saccharomonospora piscinae]|uniref:Uncharacterized protein n=1 Tax=Saccharomonospora piscinae TaxID=687388 RepID=A0A1V9A540_SACPI|nr:hypothetical protein [Saccharomonospora piscinae]OQO92064.1 hypothetical protein B1813_07280 [Saccharomonospora piscinae]TLW92255.1 hypothetical protein FFT09_15460 [Saccharomonospora piscinae]
MRRDDEGNPHTPEPDDRPEHESGGLGHLPSKDVPEPPNRDDVVPDDDVTPDAGTIEPPD